MLRPFSPDDASAFAAYRSDPDVARYQDWDVPYPEEQASALIAGCAGVEGPMLGDWQQIAIEHDGELIGDLALNLEGSGRQAILGYTLRSDRQGQGFAAEAAGALVDRLFTGFGVHRISATLDPANVSSARLLERLGFYYEGRSPGAAWVRGEWLDDDRYAIRATDRAAWRARKRAAPAEVRLVEVTPDNVAQVYRLATHHSQKRFVATMPWNFTAALVPEVVDGAALVPWYRAVEADGDLVAFVMCAEVTAAHPEPYLWRFLVDRWHQRRSIGARAIRLVVDHAREQGADTLLTSWVEGPGSPEPFYRGLGFEPTGAIVDGEIEARLRLPQLAE